MATTQADQAAQADKPGTPQDAARNGRGSRRFGLAHRLYTGDISYDFVGRRRTWYILSGSLILISILALAFRGLNLGIEFRGGADFQATTKVSSATIADTRAAVSKLGLPDMGDFSVTTIGSSTVQVQTRSLTTVEEPKVRAAIAKVAGSTTDNVAYQLIGPSWGSQILSRALQALLVFLVLVTLVIWLYFRDWRMSAAALIALLHDLTITVGIYALVGFSVSPATMIGVLTILGYSLYDTVVVFDKVRENVKNITQQNRTYTAAANAAVNQVLVRSINTTLIGVLPVAAILFAGSVVLGTGPLEDLGLALFVGMICGAYSSIFIATPLLAQLKEIEPQMKQHRVALERRTARAEAKPPKVKVAARSAAAAGTIAPSVPVTLVADDRPAASAGGASAASASGESPAARAGSGSGSGSGAGTDSVAGSGSGRPVGAQRPAVRQQRHRTTRSQRKK